MLHWLTHNGKRPEQTKQQTLHKIPADVWNVSKFNKLDGSGKENQNVAQVFHN